MDRGAWWAIVHGVAKSQIQLSEHTHMGSRKNGSNEPICRAGIETQS